LKGHALRAEWQVERSAQDTVDHIGGLIGILRGTGGLEGEIVHVAITPPWPSGIIGPGSKASF
jgi:hypothetical protein